MRTYPLLPWTTYKWDLWPWRYWMTIGIGVLAWKVPPIVTEDAPVPNRIILCADRLGSYGDIFSTGSMFKIFGYSQAKLYAVASGDISKAGELLKEMSQAVEHLQREGEEPGYHLLVDAICKAVNHYKSDCFRREVVPKYGIAPKRGWKEEAKHLGVLDDLLKKEWPPYSIGCQLIIGTFSTGGVAHLFYVASDGEVHTANQPGFVSIGTGAQNSDFWLAYREQHSGMGIVQSAYHAYEAKLMAERSPHVGKDDIQMVVASAWEFFYLGKENPAPDGCPVSLTQIQELHENYGSRKTDDLAEEPNLTFLEKLKNRRWFK